LYATQKSAGNLLLQWSDANPDKAHTKYAIYRFPGGTPVDLSDPGHIIALTQGDQFMDTHYATNQNYHYVVTALDRSWNESPPSNIVTGY
jgi:hypothetical protein